MRISDWSSDGCSSDLFTDITASLAHRLQEADITLTVNPLPQLTSDRLALEQVFSNLLDNAIKYMRNNIPGRIDVTVTDTMTHYLISVADNGRGIARRDRKSTRLNSSH